MNLRAGPLGPAWPFPGRIATDTEEPIVSVSRGAEPPTGPPSPRPGEAAPHQDVGQLVSDFLGDIQGAGETISQLLDQPLHQTIGIDGPHRIVDNGLDFGNGLIRGVIRKLLKRGAGGQTFLPPRFGAPW